MLITDIFLTDTGTGQFVEARRIARGLKQLKQDNLNLVKLGLVEALRELNKTKTNEIPDQTVPDQK